MGFSKSNRIAGARGTNANLSFLKDTRVQIISKFNERNRMSNKHDKIIEEVAVRK